MPNTVLEKHLDKQQIQLGGVLPRLLKRLEASALSEEEKRKVRHRIFVLLHRTNHGKDKKTASGLTAIFNDSVKNILTLTEPHIGDIKTVGLSNIYSSLTSIYTLHKKFPKTIKTDMKHLLLWCTGNGVVNFNLLKSITGMMAGRGMPKEEDITNLKEWCTENGVVNFELLRSITGMQMGRGMPKEEDIRNLKEWCKEDGVVNFELLRSITGMMHGRGMPKEEDIRNLKEWCGGYNDLFRYISGKQEGFSTHEQFLTLQAEYKKRNPS